MAFKRVPYRSGVCIKKSKSVSIRSYYNSISQSNDSYGIYYGFSYSINGCFLLGVSKSMITGKGGVTVYAKSVNKSRFNEL